MPIILHVFFDFHHFFGLFLCLYYISMVSISLSLAFVTKILTLFSWE